MVEMSIIITTTVENLPEALRVLKEKLKDQNVKASAKPGEPTKVHKPKAKTPESIKMSEPITTNEAKNAYAGGYR